MRFLSFRNWVIVFAYGKSVELILSSVSKSHFFSHYFIDILLERVREKK